MLRDWSRARKITFASFAIVIFAYAWFIWSRRWISDDGMIYLRTVRQILDGNGPVFNAFERAESNTSALWIWILAAFGAVIGDLSRLAAFLGGLMSLGGLAIGMDATRRLLRARGSTAPIVPAGAFVIAAAYPFWDFATSGLETGPAFLWLAGSWWLLVTRRHWIAAIVFGLGPLVRPELAVASIGFFAALWLLERPPWRRVLGLAAAGIALPLAYEVFRAGYYGTLVPLPALAKRATHAEWSRGLIYLRDFIWPGMLFVPAAALIATFAMHARGIARRERILVATPLVIGAVLVLYVTRVGGDFMHARLLLVPTFALLLPGLVIPLTKRTALVIGALVVWSIVTVIRVGDGRSHVTGGSWIGDERVGYWRWTRRDNPIDPSVYIAADSPGAPRVASALHERRRELIWQDGPILPMSPHATGPLVYVVGRLGTGGAVAPLDAIVADTLGLANPLGARITPTNPGQTGHEKVIPRAWLLADFGHPDHDHHAAAEVPAYMIRAARRAMKCGELAELLASVREPMSASRFWANLTGSLRRTRLVVPHDPVEAEQKFCGATTLPLVLASSAYPFDGWGKYNVVDGERVSLPLQLGHTSYPRPDNRVEWLELRFAKARPIAQVVLYQALEGEGFPLDFEIQIWDGERWVARASAKEFSPKGKGVAMAFSWPTPDTTNRVRIVATKLRVVAGHFVFHLGEIELP